MNTKPWTIKSVLTWTTDYFKEKSIESPRLSAEILLAETLGLNRIDLYVQFDRPLDKTELKTYKDKILRRAQHEPVAYIVGTKDFWQSTFGVSPHVLIPRPDTETLVETAINYINHQKYSLRILELGVGSGAISVSLARECPDHNFFATDSSCLAIQQASENALSILNQNHPIQFIVSDWFSALANLYPFDLIISNPPYIPSHEIQKLQPDIFQYEPLTALDGGSDGLNAFRMIIEEASGYLILDGTLMLEMGFDQGVDIQKLVDSNPDYTDMKIIKDDAGHDRVAVITSQGII